MPLGYQNNRSKVMKFEAIQCSYDECSFTYAADNKIIEIVIYADDTASTTMNIGIRRSKRSDRYINTF